MRSYKNREELKDTILSEVVNIRNEITAYSSKIYFRL